MADCQQIAWHASEQTPLLLKPRKCTVMNGPVTSGFAHRDTDDSHLPTKRGSPRVRRIASGPYHNRGARAIEECERCTWGSVLPMRFSHLPCVDHHRVV